MDDKAKALLKIVGLLQEQQNALREAEKRLMRILMLRQIDEAVADDILSVLTSNSLDRFNLNTKIKERIEALVIEHNL